VTDTVDIETLRRARAQASALIGFSIYNLEQGLGIVRAAESEGLPVLLQAGSSAFRYARREPLAALALGLARSSRAAVGVHLDHATEIAEVQACLDAGYSSVMFDGSALPLFENSRLTREVVRRAHAAGAWVEAELAGIAGDEDVSAASRATELTDPEQAARFVDATGIDALAVAVGNVHGISSTPISLDLARLGRIAELVDVPLVLHGASGLPDTDVRAAIELGVAKLNVNAELRRAFRAALVEVGTAPPSDDGIAALLAPAIEATQAAARAKLRAFTAPRTTSTPMGAQR